MVEHLLQCDALPARCQDGIDELVRLHAADLEAARLRAIDQEAHAVDAALTRERADVASSRVPPGVGYSWQTVAMWTGGGVLFGAVSALVIVVTLGR